MARLTEEQWSEVRAHYATGRYANRDLAEMYGVSHVAIQKKAKAEEWSKADSESVTRLIKAKADYDEEVSKLPKVTNTDSGNFAMAIDVLAEFEAKSNRRMAKVEDKAMTMLDSAESPVHVKAIMETLVKHREARLGKRPDTAIDTAIQINNNASSSLESNYLKRMQQDFEH
ncbi:MAG: hypothetical protein B7X60_01280 [Polynucleobacter sp. 39-45-136]|nr:MAG: hypothetical protein B7X60_01280 [Polynucleobacter sp. 39-45-136]